MPLFGPELLQRWTMGRGHPPVITRYPTLKALLVDRPAPTIRAEADSPYAVSSAQVQEGFQSVFLLVPPAFAIEGSACLAEIRTETG